jgi:hypothetical protein
MMYPEVHALADATMYYPLKQCGGTRLPGATIFSFSFSTDKEVINPLWDP